MEPRTVRSGYASQFNDAELRWFGADDSAAPRTRAADSLAARVAGIVGVRPLPEVGRVVLALLGTGAQTSPALEALVASDVALAAKVVRFAATARAVEGQPISTVGQAIERVGPRMLPGLVASAVTDAPYADPAGAGREMHLHALGVGRIAAVLGDFYGLSHVDELYLCGLFHDVGRLLRLQAGESPDLDDTEEELVRFGYDHAVLGSEVLRRWRVSDNVVRVVALHHHPGRIFAASPDLALRVSLVRLADRLDGWMAAATPMTDVTAHIDADDGLATYVDFTTEYLESLWPALVAARAQAHAAYPARAPQADSGGNGP